VASFTTVKKIGSGCVFTTPQSHEDGAPANHVTAELSAAGTFAVASFVQGETLNFSGSGAVGKFLDTDSTGPGTGSTISYGLVSGNVTNGNTVTGATSGATCVISGSTPSFVKCVWRGEINASSDVFTAVLAVSGGTTDIAAYYELTTATGAALKDHADVAANTMPLRIDLTKGCGIDHSAAYTIPITNNQAYSRFSYLQVKTTGGGGGAPAFYQQLANVVLDVHACLFESVRTNVVDLYGTNNIMRNSLIVCRGASKNLTANVRNSARLINCTAVTPSDIAKPTNILGGAYGAASIKNTALFWGTGLYTSTAPTFTTCANDNGSPPSGVSQVTYDTSLFENISDGTHDFRLPAGSALIGAGTVDNTYALTDIFGRTRGATNDIGCWQRPPAAAVARMKMVRQAVNRASTH